MKTDDELISDWIETNKITYIQPNTKTKKQKIKIRKKLRSKKGHRKKGSRK